MSEQLKHALIVVLVVIGAIFTCTAITYFAEKRIAEADKKAAVQMALADKDRESAKSIQAVAERLEGLVKTLSAKNAVLQEDNTKLRTKLTPPPVLEHDTDATHLSKTLNSLGYETKPQELGAFKLGVTMDSGNLIAFNTKQALRVPELEGIVASDQKLITGLHQEVSLTGEALGQRKAEANTLNSESTHLRDAITQKDRQITSQTVEIKALRFGTKLKIGIGFVFGAAAVELVHRRK